MDDKEKNGNDGSGRYQRKKWGDKQNKKDKNSAKDSGIPHVVDSNGITYTNRAWNNYLKKCGVYKTHMNNLNESWKKEGGIFKLPPTHPFSLKLTGNGNGRNKQASVAVSTFFSPTTTVTSSMNNMSNKELISKTHDIFEGFSRTTQDPDLTAAMEKLYDVWSLNQRVAVYVSGVDMDPKC